MTEWLHGVGLHTGEAVAARLLPAPAGAGLLIRRVDVGAEMMVSPEAVLDQARCTCLSDGTFSVETVEHVLAALVGLRIADAVIEVDGPEVPILDGSALAFVEAARQACLPSRPLDRAITIRHQVEYGGASLTLAPGPDIDVVSEIAFDHPAIGHSRASWDGDAGTFIRAIAPARSFVLAQDVDELRTAGRIRGGSLACAVVFGNEGALNPEGLRFPDEPARHKLLDLIGDLALLGGVPRGQVHARRYSHRLGARAFRKADRGALSSEGG